MLFTIGSMGAGGAERQVIEYLRHLDRERFIPFLYLIAREGELLDEVPADVEIRTFWERHTYPRFNLPGRIHRQQVRDLASVIESERIDVVCSVTVLATLVAQAAAQRTAVPLVCVEMSDPRLDFHSTVKRFVNYKRGILAKAYARAARVVAVSNGVREGIREFYGVPDGNLETIPNFVDLARIDALSDALTPDFETDRLHIVSVGRLHPVKGHRYLLEAMDELVNSRKRTSLLLHLIGDGPQRSQLEQFVKDRGLSDSVRFEGFQQNPFPYLKHAQLYCLPSLYEGLPLSLVEAIACRARVVATDCPSGPREVLDGGKYGRLVPTADSASLARAIDESLFGTPETTSSGDEGRHYVEAEYSAPACMHKFERVLEESAAPRTSK